MGKLVALIGLCLLGRGVVRGFVRRFRFDRSLRFYRGLRFGGSFGFHRRFGFGGSLRHGRGRRFGGDLRFGGSFGKGRGCGLGVVEVEHKELQLRHGEADAVLVGAQQACLVVLGVIYQTQVSEGAVLDPFADGLALERQNVAALGAEHGRAVEYPQVQTVQRFLARVGLLELVKAGAQPEKRLGRQHALDGEGGGGVQLDLVADTAGGLGVRALRGRGSGGGGGRFAALGSRLAVGDGRGGRLRGLRFGGLRGRFCLARNDRGRLLGACRFLGGRGRLGDGGGGRLGDGDLGGLVVGIGAEHHEIGRAQIAQKQDQDQQQRQEPFELFHHAHHLSIRILCGKALSLPRLDARHWPLPRITFSL